MTEWQLYILGCGRGATHVLRGEPSSSVVLCRDGRPQLWVDTGLGASRACIEAFGELPQNIIITHNHTDHAGELPVVLAVERKQGRRPVVIAEHEVMRRLREHRMAEHHDWLPVEQLAHWRDATAGQRLDLGAGLAIVFMPGRHVEHSCGFVIFAGERRLLGYTGDSGFDATLYEFVLGANCALLDMREHGSENHAALADFDPAWRGHAHIIGHGLSAGDAAAYSHLPLCHAGQRIDIHERNPE